MARSSEQYGSEQCAAYEAEYRSAYETQAQETTAQYYGGDYSGIYNEEEKEDEMADCTAEFNEAVGQQTPEATWTQPKQQCSHVGSDFAYAKALQAELNQQESYDNVGPTPKATMEAEAADAVSCLVSPGAYSPSNFKRFGTYWNPVDEMQSAFARRGESDSACEVD